jgi:tetratricopeptide (TPR) repeat protein
MNSKTIRRILLLTGCTLVMLNYFSLHAQATETASTKVQFPNSCNDAVQDDFNNAITLLHSFEYPETTRIFGEIMEVDPDCAMARWGAAMSNWHPLWAPPSREELEKGAALLAGTGKLSATDRESAYIDAAKAFFSSTDTSTHRDRARKFEAKMGELYASHLDDPEAALFYALSLLATADPRDKTYAHQFKSAGLLNWVRDSHPTHPGVLHYMIHSYDFPGLAHLALASAKTYASAAPDSAHAQHMPSHIFTRLGLWERSINSNHDSTRSAAEYTVRAHLSGHYDEGLHGMDYLMYAMLQTARDEEASKLLLTLQGIGKTNTENFKVAYTYAASPARFVLERRRWEDASKLELKPTDFLWDEFPWAQSIHHFARGIGAARSNQVEQARAELQMIKTLQARMSDATSPYWREEAAVQVDMLDAWITYAEGDEGEALRLAAAAANREDAVDKNPVTPGEVLPARELYADLLIETGNYAKSLEQYRMVLTGSPNRLNALLGAASAASHTGDTKLAEKYLNTARKQTESGNRQRKGLDQVWTASLRE